MEDFVSYKIARKLKGKGFREKTFAYYPSSGILQWRRAYIYDTPITDVMKCSNKENTTIDAPTISQVLKWLREEKKIHIEFVGNACGYLFIVSDIPSKGGTDRYCSDYSGPNDGGTWDSYEEAAIAGIEYCLDNLI